MLKFLIPNLFDKRNPLYEGKTPDVLVEWTDSAGMTNAGREKKGAKGIFVIYVNLQVPKEKRRLPITL